MSIRNGGRLRQDRANDQAHRMETPPTGDGFPPGARDRLVDPGRALRASRPRDLRSDGRPRHGFLRFIAFAAVLAVFVLAVLVTVMRPLVSSAITGWAAENPSALGIPFVADIVRSDLGTALTTAPSADSSPVDFTVDSGETAVGIADRLAANGFLVDRRAFVFEAIMRGVASDFKAGTYSLRHNMTPNELVTTLLAPPPDRSITITFREGLRLEQITALLQTKPVTMDVNAFYQLALHPTPELLSHYPWLQLPKGASLEGFLAPATYRMLPDITPEDLIRQMLDHFYETVGQDRIDVPAARGLTFYQVVSLASIVELEAKVDSERALIAGVYTNRLNKKLNKTGLLNADPTVIYAADTIQLRNLPFNQWPQFSFWNLPSGAMDAVKVPADLAGYQTYKNPGLIPGPICSPTVASIDAALKPDTKAGYLYFVAKNDGSGTHAFARTYAEHLANLRKYGYAP